MASPSSSPISTVWAKLSGDLGNEVFSIECDLKSTTIDNMKRIVKFTLSPLLDTIAAPKLIVKGSDGSVLREDITLASRPEGKAYSEPFIIEYSNIRDKFFVEAKKDDDHRFKLQDENAVANQALAIASPAENVNYSAEKFFDSIFPSMSAPLTDIKSATGIPCIIDICEATMGHEYIGTDSLQRNIAEIRKAVSCSPSFREKPLVVVVLGSGGGKTRLLEECRRQLNQDEKTVVIAITMNSHMDYVAKTEQFFPGEENLPANMALSVLTRVMSVVYNQPIKNSRKMLRNSVKFLDPRDLLDPDDIADFIREGMNRAIYSINSQLNAQSMPSINQIVLMVDEVMRLQDDISNLNRFPEAEVEIQFKSFLSSLNKGLLNVAFFHGTEEIRATLVISSLEVNAKGYIDYKRDIAMLSTPTLSTDFVLSNWLLRGFKDVPKYSVNRFRFELIAQTLVGVPRLLQFARSFIESRKTELVSQESVNIKSVDVQELYKEVFGRVYKRYSFGKPKGIAEKIFSLIYSMETSLDSVSTYLIRKSFFSTHPIVTTSEKYITFFPKGSIVMLAAYDFRCACLPFEEIFSASTVNFNNGNLIFYNTFASLLKTISSDSKEGDALEEVGVAWLIARLVAARQKGLTSIFLSQLLDVEMNGTPLVIATPNIERKFYFEDLKSKKNRTSFELLPPISSDHQEYARLFNELISVDEKLSPCKIFKSSPGQKYDVMVVSVVDGHVHIIFMDMKSRREYSDDDGRSVDLEIDQYDRVHDVINELKTLEASGVELSPISRALFAGNFTFVYTTTFPDVNLFRYNDDGTIKYEESEPRNLVVMLRSDTKKFLGILWEFYRSARSMLLQKWPGQRLL